MASPLTFSPTFSLQLSAVLLLLLSSSSSSSAAATLINESSFLLCLSSKFPSATHLSSVVYTQNSSSFDSLLQFSAQNPYLSTPSTPNKPLYIITPVNEAQIQASVICSKRHGLQIRVRSGGHDYEGLSYLALEPFLILDLIEYRAIDINVGERTAWVQAGATLGELYYGLASTSLGFPAGVCTTLGLGAVTVFTVSRTVEEGATGLMGIWQNVAPRLPDELVIRVILQAATTRSTVQASFNSLYLGSAQDLLSVMKLRFPELGLRAEDCQQMSWVDSTMYFDGFPSGTPREALLNRTKSGRNSFKATSDFVVEPISEEGLRGLWGKLLEEPRGLMIWEPLGGKINAVSETETPFPHRRGNLYNIQHYVNWDAGADAQRYIDWIRSLYSFVTPYVTRNPRGAYLNYKDLDLGRNINGPNTSYETASVWGLKYFKGNFRRLALVKGRVDKDNYFRNEQSIPPLLA
ncbi:hypothetical protein H6P81_019105 [Aristolochia fimbriata]|uniref:FAD-binding PCMH-type domain-containing protein n=1 Tax=Aristolochia fimbriata TaxID=158543 RepID=A0AAV7DSA6_ARIFI|nr:hypothetical protein H6P81_019105 [Aristolochia fimbriata]